uniref:Inhibin alpha chain n=1 Tax=Hucho hucho TaxID=62062 RepID=A0A4W5LIM4_9TELE
MWSGPSTVLSCALLLLWTQTCQGDELPRDVVLDWIKQRLLDGLGLEQPPEPSHQAPDGGRERAEESHEQVILFPSSDSTCDSSDSPSERATSHFTYYFQSSLDNQESAITSAHFWFYAGEGASRNITPLFLLTSNQQLLQVAVSGQDHQYSDCQREMINISFQELGWDNWIVHPKVLNFYYCHGTCSALDGTTAMLGIKQCCATTLPNIIPEECTCI